jgi:hypothetical protein
VRSQTLTDAGIAKPMQYLYALQGFSQDAFARAVRGETIAHCPCSPNYLKSNQVLKIDRSCSMRVLQDGMAGRIRNSRRPTSGLPAAQRQTPRPAAICKASDRPTCWVGVARKLLGSKTTCALSSCSRAVCEQTISHAVLAFCTRGTILENSQPRDLKFLFNSHYYFVRKLNLSRLN